MRTKIKIYTWLKFLDIRHWMILDYTYCNSYPKYCCLTRFSNRNNTQGLPEFKRYYICG